MTDQELLASRKMSSRRRTRPTNVGARATPFDAERRGKHVIRLLAYDGARPVANR
jgi:hypothetical protein